MIQQLHQLACNGLTPDLTLLLDLDPEAGLARAWRRIHADAAHAQESRFEKERLAFHQRVRAGYLDLARHRTAALCHHRRFRRRKGGRCAD
jgi:dTMP kinase